MSQGCISCTNQPSDNGSLGGAGHEGTVTPMVIGIIIGTVFVFILVVCALFYCVKLENNKYMAKIGDTGGGDLDSGDGESVKSQPSSSSVTVVPVSMRVVQGSGETVGVRELLPRSEAMGASVGGAGGRGEGKRKLFGWGKKSGKSFPYCVMMDSCFLFGYAEIADCLYACHSSSYRQFTRYGHRDGVNNISRLGR